MTNYMTKNRKNASPCSFVKESRPGEKEVMKYFVRNEQRVGGCYYEFYKGTWDGHTFWKNDSIFLHDDVMTDGFIESIIEVIPAYDPFGKTEISSFEWRKIGENTLSKDTESQEQYKEADKWLKCVFQKHNCFTILGI